MKYQEIRKFLSLLFFLSLFCISGTSVHAVTVTSSGVDTTYRTITIGNGWQVAGFSSGLNCNKSFDVYGLFWSCPSSLNPYYAENIFDNGDLVSNTWYPCPHPNPLLSACSHWIENTTSYTCTYTSSVKTWGVCNTNGIQYATSFYYSTISGSTCSDIAPTWRSCTPTPINTAPNVPTITGPTTGVTNTSYSFTATASDPDGDAIRYGFDWDNNGTVDAWAPPSATYVPSGTSQALSHQWAVAGTKTFKVRACDSNGNCSGWSAPHTITIAVPNAAPNTPTLSGPTAGTTGISYSFIANTTDPEGDAIRYGFDWDNDGTVDAWAPTAGYVTSGTGQTLSHQWAVAGTKTFKVRACDSNGNYSAWSAPHTISVTLPLSVTLNSNPSTTANVGDTVTWRAVVTGGVPPYTYTWSNAVVRSVSIVSTMDQVTAVFGIAGTVAIERVVVTDSSTPAQSVWKEDSVTIVDNRLYQ